MIIKAIFKGRNYSMGFRTGGLYRLRVKIKDSKMLIFDRDRKYISCPYNSLLEFLENWEVIE